MLNAATINTNVADKASSARMPPTGWASGSSICRLVRKTRGSDANQDDTDKDESQSFVAAKRTRQPFEQHSTFRIRRTRARHREHKKVELLDDKAERNHGNARAHPGEKSPLVGRMIRIAADYETPR